MKLPVPFDDAVDLLDADHKSVKKLFTDYSGLCEINAPAEDRQDLAERICRALTVHAQLEEEIFYPQVRKAIGDDALIDEALGEHKEAKKLIALIEGMDASQADYDATVLQLGKVIDEHVFEEREQIFLRARLAALDLRGMTLPLLKRQMQLKKSALAKTKESA